MKNIYLDNAATTKVDEKVLDAMLPYFSDNFGNASSVYSIGRSAKSAIENARENIAKVINCKPSEIYFTSGGSESDNTAIKGIARANKEKGNHIITSKIEHLAVLESCKELEDEGFDVTYLNVNNEGLIDIEELKKEVRPTTILISIMFANNEIGTIEPIYEIGKIAKENNIYFHTDAVQAVGSVDIDVQKLNIDSLSMSAHKIYGPKGVGALFVRHGINFKKYISGGHQERNKRASTENVPGIVGLEKAIQIARDSIEERTDKITKLRDYYEDQVKEKIKDIRVNGCVKSRLPSISNISFKGIKGDSLLLSLDMKGICASYGSACTSLSLENSYVLTEIGVGHEYIKGSLRVSIGKYNTKDEIDYLVNCLQEIIERIRNV